jgi:hypothetical protein
MRQHLFVLALGGLTVLTACKGSSENPPQWNPYSALPPRNENYHGGPGAALKKYDANKDGILTRDELVAGLRAEFNAAATGSTCLSPQKVAAINQARVAADQSAATPLQDWNQDGCVSFQEFATAPASLFDEMDRDHDGKISAREFDLAAGLGGRGGQGRTGQQGGEGRGPGRRGGP